MTEAEARAALRAFIGVGDIEPWIARRPWQVAPSGWTVAGGLRVRQDPRRVSIRHVPRLGTEFKA